MIFLDVQVEIIKGFSIILVAFVTAFGGAAAKFHYENKKLKEKNDLLKNEIKDLSISIQMDLQIFNDIKSIVENILFNTKADRFLILTATNGTSNMRFASAIYEQHKKSEKVLLSIGATGKYVKFEFDSHYREMLKNAENLGTIHFETATMLDSDLRNIYETENISFSNIHFLMRGKIDDANDRLFYCSVATHCDEDFTKSENVIIKTSIDKLKSKFKDI